MYLHIKKCTFHILDKYSTCITNKELTKYVEIREQTASLNYPRDTYNVYHNIVKSKQGQYI